MFDTPVDKEIQSGIKFQSKLISIVIRNAMEDFHTKHLSDAQMKELNPIIRNAVYTALYSMHYCKDSMKLMEFISYQSDMIPDYWEEPELNGKVSE
jgi:transcription termination factor NusB